MRCFPQQSCAILCRIILTTTLSIASSTPYEVGCPAVPQTRSQPNTCNVTGTVPASAASHVTYGPEFTHSYNDCAYECTIRGCSSWQLDYVMRGDRGCTRYNQTLAQLGFATSSETGRYYNNADCYYIPSTCSAVLKASGYNHVDRVPYVAASLFLGFVPTTSRPRPKTGPYKRTNFTVHPHTSAREQTDVYGGNLTMTQFGNVYYAVVPASEGSTVLSRVQFVNKANATSGDSAPLQCVIKNGEGGAVRCVDARGFAKDRQTLFACNRTNGLINGLELVISLPQLYSANGSCGKNCKDGECFRHPIKLNALGFQASN